MKKMVMLSVCVIVFGFVLYKGTKPIKAIDTVEESTSSLIKPTTETESTRATLSGVWGTSPWTFNDGVLTIGAGNLGDISTAPWTTDEIEAGYVNIITFTGKVIAPRDSWHLFAGTRPNIGNGISYLKEIRNAYHLDTSQVTSMDGMFQYSRYLTTIDVSTWDISKVETMAGMFQGVAKLPELNVSEWDTSNVTSLDRTFSGMSSLTSLNVSGWNVSQVKTLGSTFQNMSNLMSLDVSMWDTSNVQNMSATFEGVSNVTSLDVSSWDTSNVTTLDRTFSGMSSLTSLNVSGWNVSQVKTLGSTFQNMSNLMSLDVSMWDTSNVQNMSATFEGVSNVTSLEVSKWHTANVTTMRSMFSQMGKVTSLNLSEWDTSKVTRMDNMFFNAVNLTTIGEKTEWNTGQVQNMNTMFSRAQSLENLDVSKWNMENVTTTQAMFNRTSSLKSLDVSKWDTSKIISMTSMFAGTAVTDLEVSDWNTSSVIDMTNMFSSVNNLANLDVQKWDTSSVTSVSAMFADSSLTSLDLSNWNTENVTRFDLVFTNASKLITVGDLSKWNTSKVTTMIAMFQGTAITQLDLSNWDTSKVTTMHRIFMSSNKLTNLDIYGWTFNQNTVTTEMFAAAYQLSWLRIGPSFAERSNKLNGEKLYDLTPSSMYSGRWIGISETNKGLAYQNSTALMSIFDPAKPGIFVWEKTQESLVVKDSSIDLGSIWKPEDNFVSATANDASIVDFSKVKVTGTVDTSIPGDYEVTYTYGKQVKVATITVVSVDAVLTVNFVNEAGAILSNYTLLIDSTIGSHVYLTEETSLINQLKNITEAGYEIVERPLNESDIVITSEKTTVTYKLQGTLSLASIPLTLDFGSVTYDATMKRVENPNYKERIIVNDTRANAKNGWNLTATLLEPMKNAKKQELIDALRYVNNGKEVILNEDAQPIYVHTGNDSGSYDVTNSWGSSKGTDGLKLQINSSDVVYTGNYTGKVTWKIVAGQP